MFNYDVISPLSRHYRDENKNDINTDDSVIDDLELANHHSPLPLVFSLSKPKSKPIRARHSPNMLCFFINGAILIGLVFPLVIFVCVLAIKLQNLSSDSSNDFTNYNCVENRVRSTKGVIATDNPTCSDMGAKILQSGGNAVDAAITAALCLGVVSPVSSGIGGGCFILSYNRTTGKSEFIDARETAPAATTRDMFVKDPSKATNGPLAIAIPGELRGLYLAWTRYGSKKLSWQQLVTPVAELASLWTISPTLSNYLRLISTELLTKNAFPELQKLYLKNDGTIKNTFDTVSQPELSKTLHNIAAYGPDYFYNTIAAQLAAEIQSLGGIMTESDIRSYQPSILEPIRTDFMGYTYIGVGGSSSGGAAVAGILKFMGSFKDPLVSQGSIYYHRLVEAMKHVFAMRLSLGDPSFANTSSCVDAMLSDSYMQALQTNTSDATVLPIDSYGGKYSAKHASTLDSGTTHISVMDAQGNAVSMTSTINTYFGSKVVSSSSGVLFNNQMDDFSIPSGAVNFFGLAASPLNYPQPGKKPLSSMSPSLVLDRRGRIRLIGGASGGPRIITATAQVILNYLGRGMDVLQAVVQPRIHSQLLPTTVDVEAQSLVGGKKITASIDVLRALLSTHHNATYFDGAMGVAQFIAVDPDSGEMEAVSDPRKGGTPSAVL